MCESYKNPQLPNLIGADPVATDDWDYSFGLPRHKRGGNTEFKTPQSHGTYLSMSGGDGADTTTPTLLKLKTKLKSPHLFWHHHWALIQPALPRLSQALLNQPITNTQLSSLLCGLCIYGIRVVLHYKQTYNFCRNSSTLQIVTHSVLHDLLYFLHQSATWSYTFFL